MAKVSINRFDGGYAQSERPETTNENLGILGFDVFQDKFKLRKANACEQRIISNVSSSTDINLLDAIKRDTDGLIVGIGTNEGSGGGSGILRFYSNASGGLTSTWTKGTVTFGGDSVTNGNGYMVLYKSRFFGVYQKSNNTSVYEYINDSSVGSIGSTGDYNAITARPVVHSQDNIMYVAGGKTISKYDGTTWTASAITLPYNITSMCEYGTYLAIACQAPFGGVIYLWGRDTSLTTLQDIIKVDSGKLMIIENLDGILTSVSQTPFDPSVASGSSIGYSNFRTLTVRQYTGSQMKKNKSVTYSVQNEAGQDQSLQNRKLIKNGTLYFSTSANCLWRFGVNSDGQYILTQDMNISYLGTNIIALYSFFLLGDYIMGCVRVTTGVITPTDGITVFSDATGSVDSSDSSYYISPINPNMPIEDRGKKKKLKKIGVRVYVANTTQGSVVLQYSLDGGSYLTATTQSSTFSTKLNTFIAEVNDDLSQFDDFTEIKIKVSVTYEVDVLEVFYEYDDADINR